MGGDVEGGGGAVIDDDQIAAVAVIGAGGVHDPVGADDGALIDAGVDGQQAFGFADDIAGGS